jgi:hypothetical protein
VSLAAARALVLRWPQASCVLHTHDVLAFDEDGASARFQLRDAPVPLASFIPGAVDDPERHQLLRLIVRAQGRHVAFRVAASCELLDSPRFYSLPRLLRASGCPTWLRGLALVRDHLTGQEQPLPWLHLGELAEWLPGNHAHRACAEGRA